MAPLIGHCCAPAHPPAGKPRRLSLKFLKEERARLEHWREGCRQQYQSGAAALADSKVADHLPRPLAVGQVRLPHCCSKRLVSARVPPLLLLLGQQVIAALASRGSCRWLLAPPLQPMHTICSAQQASASEQRKPAAHIHSRHHPFPPLQRVVARHPTTRQLHDGQVLTAAHNCYRYALEAGSVACRFLTSSSFATRGAWQGSQRAVTAALSCSAG